MTLLDYLKSLPDDEAREAFAARCDTTYGYLKQVAYEHKNCGEALAIRLERESAGAVTCEILCPDADWAYIRSTGKTNGRNGRNGRRKSVDA